MKTTKKKLLDKNINAVEYKQKKNLRKKNLVNGINLY